MAINLCVCALVLCAVVLTKGQSTTMIRQCKCSEYSDCETDAGLNVVECMDKCTSILKKIGDTNAMKECIDAQRSTFVSMMACVTDKLGKGKADNSKMVRKFDFNQLMAKYEQIQQPPPPFPPIPPNLRDLKNVVSEFGICVKNCVQKQSNQCFEKLNCGLEFGEPAKVKQTVKQCSNNGIFASIRTLCNCFVEMAHVEQFRQVCPLITDETNSPKLPIP